MKILIPLMALVQLSTADASLIGIMDSGTDITHKDLASKAWINRNEQVGSTVDLDNDGLPGDINGWDFTANSPKVFNDKYNSLITEDVKTFFNYYSHYELGKSTSAEVLWLKSHNSDQSLMNKVNFIGGYIHGTHVAGISALKNAQAKILSMKIIPTEYVEFKKVDPKSPKLSVNKDNGEPTKTFDEYKAEVVESAAQQITEMIGLHTIINLHKVDVVNQSFGIGYGDATNFIKSGFIGGLKREPTKEEMDVLLKAYFDQIMLDGPKMYAAAPNTLFAIAAGNDASNNDLFTDYPANIKSENKIVVAATLGYKSLADFSNFGATKVDIAAPGVAITSTAPTNTYIPLSGTSQATPYVVNIIAAMKDVNPALTTRDLKAILFGTVDVKPWLKGKVKTSGIVNKSRALKAAQLAQSTAVDLAIASARVIIIDVAVEKSLSIKPQGLGFTFKPIRPSLLIKK